MGELALAWLLAQPEVCSVITGVATPQQVDANAAASGWRLDAADLLAVGALLAGAPHGMDA